MTDLAVRYRDAELSYCCAVMHVCSAEIVAAVGTDDLADPLARRIHSAAAVALAGGLAPDLVTLTLGLAPDARTAFVDVFTHAGAVPAHWKTYVDLVREGSYRRRAVAVAERIIQSAETSTTDVLAAALTQASAVTR